MLSQPGLRVLTESVILAASLRSRGSIWGRRSSSLIFSVMASLMTWLQLMWGSLFILRRVSSSIRAEITYVILISNTIFCDKRNTFQRVDGMWPHTNPITNAKQVAWARFELASEGPKALLLW